MTIPQTPDDTRLPLAILGAALALAGCGGGADATPYANVLSGVETGGNARVVAITAVDSSGAEDATYVYSDDLNAACEASWEPSGTLCDDDGSSPTTRDSATQSFRTNQNTGATWSARDGQSGLVTGQLIIDACARGCSTVSFTEASVFQMFSDGKLTHIRFFVHPELGGSAPAWDDAGWEALGPERMVGPGAHDDTDGSLVTSPTRIDFGDVVETRYVRIEARNDGTHGSQSYTEVRSVKLF
ncbi:MAG: hypothetical protein R3B40_10605 [Polyangiales bacterium]|nr:hypothetical protein [Sandaracinaceae bacterium]